MQVEHSTLDNYLLQVLLIVRYVARCDDVPDLLVVHEQVSDVVGLSEELRSESCLVDGHLAETSLLRRLLQNVLLDGLLADQSVDRHIPRLPDLKLYGTIGLAGKAYPMTTILRLRIHSRIPIGVIENDRVSARQVNANAAGTS